jgi:hypothetical protein
VLEPGALEEARRLTAMLRDDDGDLETRKLVGLFHLARCHGLPGAQAEPELMAAITMLTPCFIAGDPGPTAYLRPLLAMRAFPAAVALYDQAAASADANLISAAVDLWQRIVDAFPASDPDRAAMLTNLSAALGIRSDRTGELADLNAAVAAGQAAVDATPASDPSRALRLVNLGSALHERFRRTGDLTDANRAIQALQTVLQAAPPRSPEWENGLSNLGAALLSRFENTGEQADLDAAVETGQAALDAAPAEGPGRAIALMNLGSALLSKFERNGVLADIDAAVRADQAAAEAFPRDHPRRASQLSNLGSALARRFERTGVLADLDAAVDAAQAAVEATSGVHPLRATHLSTLGGTLLTRFRWTGALADLDDAIQAARAAVQAAPADHPGQAMYHSLLGSALRSRFRRTGDTADLEGAIQAARAAVEATSGSHPNRPAYLSGLGNVLDARFQQTGARADQEAAVQALRAAVDASPAGHPSRGRYLSNLGLFLRNSSERTGKTAELDESIRMVRAALDATPVEHPDRARMWWNLGTALQDRFQRTHAPNDRGAAVAAFTSAAKDELTTPTVRIRAAWEAASLVARSEPALATDLLEGAVRLLGEAAPRRLARSDQQRAIGQFAGMTSDAAALTLIGGGGTAARRAARSLGLLEAGRAVLLTQALDTRSDLTALRHQHPDLAVRFIELRALLDEPDDITEIPAAADRVASAASRRADGRRLLVGEFSALLQQIRSREGFATFGLPPATGELLAESAQGSVVTFNVSRYRSDALLLTATGIIPVELPGLTEEAMITQIGAFHQARRISADHDASIADRKAAEGKLLEVLGWLWDTAAAPVLDALGFSQAPRPGAAWPRVWWAPGGLLSMLPIHAAGHHEGEHARSTVMDRVISSYTPTIRALSYARHRSRLAGANDRALIVAMRVTPGLPGGGELPSVPAEVAQVRAALPHSVLLAEPGDWLTQGSAGLPTRANVIRQLPGCAIAHFACHGLTNPADPSQSLLVLHDHERSPMTVASLAPVDLSQAELAYLSACDTAVTSPGALIDEAIHLTTAFQLAGFPHVVGTLWGINDALAAATAGTFYATLRSGSSSLDAAQAASALHHVVRTIRDNLPRTPSLWAAYIHAGA